jgi:hypothetical protein
MPQSLFTPQVAQNLKARLEKLNPESKAQWGKMNVSQMLNHCSAQMEVCLDEKHLKSNFLFRIFGKFIKKNILADKPTRKNSPTAKELLPTEVKDFEQEKKKMAGLIDKMIRNQASFEGKDHPFFGKLSADEYGKITWNHIDYHFGQFGV